ncbi:MAG TPA: MBL fold metallo-hydrolase [Flavobacteriales bacterium]|nr:MBL fold metallo-hydrolase [Flavobacteriales bacterium]HNI04209.1 MBL fold metallo-hydrolase [Flavobacteriales bacterium]
MRITRFTFNPFDENTWVLDNGREALLVDPGCSDADEQRELEYWLATNRLTPIRLLLTHAHLDHVLGCAWMHRRFGLLPELHRADLPLLDLAERQGLIYGIPCEPPPAPTKFFAPGDIITLGDEQLEVLFVPGHAPGHIAFWHPEQRFVISGDVLFQRSIGRTDLPGGDMDTLIASIRTELFPLGDDVKVHCGHGPDTTIGEERRLNPFLR